MMFQALAYFCGYALTGFLTSRWLEKDEAATPTPEDGNLAPVDDARFLEALAEPWRIAIFLQCGLLIPLILMIMSTPNKYFDLATARVMRDHNKSLTHLHSLHRETPEVRWNVYSRFGAPSVVLGYGFANKVEIMHAQHNAYDPEQVKESI